MIAFSLISLTPNRKIIFPQDEVACSKTEDPEGSSESSSVAAGKTKFSERKYLGYKISKKELKCSKFLPFSCVRFVNSIALCTTH